MAPTVEGLVGADTAPVAPESDDRLADAPAPGAISCPSRFPALPGAGTSSFIALAVATFPPDPIEPEAGASARITSSGATDRSAAAEPFESGVTTATCCGAVLGDGNTQ